VLLLKFFYGKKLELSNLMRDSKSFEQTQLAELLRFESQKVGWRARAVAIEPRFSPGCLGPGCGGIGV
jgi:hypothetical protein